MQIAINILSVIILAICTQSKAMVVHPDQEFFDVNQVVVKGVFFVPQNGPNPTEEDKRALNRHIQWSRVRYRVMLNDRDTFEISRKPVEIYHSSHPLDYYREKPESGVPWQLDELFEHFGYDRNTCPYIYVIVVANEKDGFPAGGGRNFNGGLNLGGGLVIISLHTLRNSPNFQSTLRHELGHAFGLVHVNVYGYDMENNDSIMSYYKKHHTKFFEESVKPGILIPEDIRSLAINKRVFQKLTFDISKDIPQGYEINKKIVTLGAIKLPKERK
jgi:hypothetical protein